MTEDNMTREEVMAWLNHQCTKDLVERIRFTRDDTVHKWTQGAFVAETAEGTAQKNAQALAWVQALDGVLQDIEDLKEDREYA